jgi:hypothetical protein
VQLQSWLDMHPPHTHTQLDTREQQTHRSGQCHGVKTRDDCMHRGRLREAKIGAPLLPLLPLACCTEYNGPTMQPLLSNSVLRHHVQKSECSGTSVRCAERCQAYGIVTCTVAHTHTQVPSMSDPEPPTQPT